MALTLVPDLVPLRRRDLGESRHTGGLWLHGTAGGPSNLGTSGGKQQGYFQNRLWANTTAVNGRAPLLVWKLQSNLEILRPERTACTTGFFATASLVGVITREEGT